MTCGSRGRVRAGTTRLTVTPMAMAVRDSRAARRRLACCARAGHAGLTPWVERGSGRSGSGPTQVSPEGPNPVPAAQVRVTFLEVPFPLTAHWCCEIRGGPADAAARGPVDPRATAPPPRRRSAERLDLTPAAVRRHLDHLVEDGAVEAREPRVHGAPRPRPPGQGLRAHRARPRRLRPAVRRPRRPGAAVPAPRPAATRPSRRSPTGAWRSSRTRFDEVDDGPPRADARPRCWPRSSPTRATPPPCARCPLAGDQLCQQHCPVSHVAHEFPQLCEAETEAIGRVLGRHVQRLATIAHGDGVCTTCIPAHRHAHTRPTKEKVTS